MSPRSMRRSPRHPKSNDRSFTTPTTISAPNQRYGKGTSTTIASRAAAGLPSHSAPRSERIHTAEAAATNGAQQTDFYSSNFTPLPSVVDVIFSLPAPLTSGYLMIGMGGFQASQFGQLLVSLNGVAQPNFFNYQDGALASVERMFALSASDVASINAANELRLTINRSQSSDGIAFDYFQLDVQTTTTPEPASIVLLASGLAGVGVLVRRRSIRRS